MSTAAGAKPNAPIVEWGTIPAEMLHARRWVGWKYEQRPDPTSGVIKWTKVPYQVGSPTYKASSTNGKTWGTAAQAEAAYAHGDVDGVGFVLGSGWAGADFDHCRDVATGAIDEAVLAGVQLLASYAEVSPSGAGVHCLFHASAALLGRRRNNVELYGDGRFFTVTGYHLPETPASVEPREHLLAAFCALYSLRRADEGKDGKDGKDGKRQRQYPPLDLSDEELLEQAGTANDGGKFARLWAGDTSGYPSPSEAVAALLCKLAFWTRKDAARMDRLFRRSGLMSDKWEEQRGASTWGECEIASAIEYTSEVYEPGGNTRDSAPPQSEQSEGADTRDDADADEDDGPTLPGEVAAFPIEVFPEPLRKLLIEGARAFPCPPDLIGVPLLALLGAAIGNSCHLEIKRTWREAPILWTAAIAPPGAKKTPVLKMLRSCWDRRQREFMKQYNAERAEWEKKSQDAREVSKKGSTAVGAPPGPEPVVRQAYVSDVTMEALADALIVNERGVALIRDELDGWVRSMNQYKDGKGSDRQNWLSLWSGESFPLNRRNRRLPVFVSDPFVGITGGIQPDILTDLNDERGHQDGFIHRMLFAYPNVLPISGFTEDEVSKGTLDALGDIFAKLWSLQPEAEEDGTTHPVLLHFTPAGRKVWREWTEAHADEQNAPAFPAVLSGPCRPGVATGRWPASDGRMHVQKNRQTRAKHPRFMRAPPP